MTGPESVRPERTQDCGSAAVPEVDGLPADGEAEQRLGAAAKVRTPTQLAREEHVHSGHARFRNPCEHSGFANGFGQPHPTARGNPDERSVSRRSQRSTVHQQCSRLSSWRVLCRMMNNTSKMLKGARNCNICVSEMLHRSVDGRIWC